MRSGTVSEYGEGLGLALGGRSFIGGGLDHSLHRLGQCVLLIRGMQVEIDSAQWPGRVALAEYHREVRIDGDAVPEAGSAALIGVHCLEQKGHH